MTKDSFSKDDLPFKVCKQSDLARFRYPHIGASGGNAWQSVIADPGWPNTRIPGGFLAGILAHIGEKSETLTTGHGKEGACAAAQRPNLETVRWPPE